MTHALPELPYALDALAPHLSKEALEYHHGKHHRAYVDNLNKLIPGTPAEKKPLEDIVREATGAVFNNAAQIWNHTFYFLGLAPKAGGEPKGPLAEAIASSFGGFKPFQEKFTQSGMGLFGSGWTWLIRGSGGKLEIVNSANADTPLREGKRAVLTCDVWEHAYYIDYRNARAKYLDNFWALVNWEEAGRRFSGA